MGRHAALDLDAHPLDMPSTQQPTEWYATVEGSTEPIKRRVGWLPAFIMLLGAVVSAGLLVVVTQRWPGPINLATGVMLIGLAVAPYLIAMLGMLLLHWREL